MHYSLLLMLINKPLQLSLLAHSDYLILTITLVINNALINAEINMNYD